MFVCADNKQTSDGQRLNFAVILTKFKRTDSSYQHKKIFRKYPANFNADRTNFITKSEFFMTSFDDH